MDYTLLNNGVKVPMLGLGTYRIGKTDNDVYNAIRTALDVGYRHIDTATLYANEAPIGKAIRESGIPREDIFVTTKLWGDDMVKNEIQQAFDRSMQLLDIGYIDLYLVHWPVKGKLVSTWHEMEKIYASEKAKAIGLSNHLQHHLEEILQEANVLPTVNQVEMHPYVVLDDLVDFCKENAIVCEAWSPLGSNKVPLLEEKILKDIGEKYGKLPAQVVLRWNIERGVIAIPKSSNKERQTANLDIFDFQLTKEDVQLINSLDKNYRTGIHPDEIEF
ncbi:MAG: Glyoxal reductase [Firmicutes bacterium ADurb.Bin419]|jgi:diketogulonate reductase-like aldo/keto reductase|nr:MAG: Glyoxal reductase [Firmicutes bacterium ADurb.Bin419]